MANGGWCILQSFIWGVYCSVTHHVWEEGGGLSNNTEHRKYIHVLDIRS